MDQFTAQLSHNTITYITGQYFDTDEPFALPRYGNNCTPYTTGRDYFKAVADAIRNAKKFIFITGWELDYDVELDQRGETGHPGRLSELLADAMQRGVHIRVILYDSVKAKLDTHDDATQDKLTSLPEGKGSIKVMLQNPNTGRDSIASEIPKMAIDAPMNANEFFAHHQKSVIIDGNIAFLGGMDLAYGRWDTNAFNVVIDPKIHVINDAYNEQVERARALNPDENSLTKDGKDRPGFHPSYKDDGKVLDELHQPRQPWQDVAISIDGPAAFDVFSNFLLRWNSFAKTFTGTNFFDMQLSPTWLDKNIDPKVMADPLADGAGSVNIQICRSASSAQLNDELELWDGKHRYVTDDWKKADPKRRKILKDARTAWKGNHQTSIRDAMINCIRSAQGFIYIENQFFMSDCGVDKNGTACPANNYIISELANAIGKAISAGRPFHVYLVLPEHPEGSLEEASVNSQAWWALQGIRHAKKSLVHRINEVLCAKNKKLLGIEKLPDTNAAIQQLLSDHGIANKWESYLTVLNLRNYGHTHKAVLTEMIYVHSKVMIVDDAVAIIGSANINDRSLNGDGDTELAAVIMDTTDAKMTDVGEGIRIITRKFARDLRMQLWKKHLGMEVDQSTTGVQKQALPAGINIKEPLNKATIRGIKNLAEGNRKAYNEVFKHTPRNSFATLDEGRKSYPFKTIKVQQYKNDYHSYSNAIPNKTVDEPTKIRDFSTTPPLQDAYMTNGQHNINNAVGKLNELVKGFWVEMPLEWGALQKNTPNAPASSPQTIADNKNYGETEIHNG